MKNLIPELILEANIIRAYSIYLQRWDSSFRMKEIHKRICINDALALNLKGSVISTYKEIHHREIKEEKPISFDIFSIEFTRENKINKLID